LRRSTVFEFLNNRPELKGNKVDLRPRRIEDAADDFRWRTDGELCQLDATIPLPYSYEEFTERFSLELEFPGMTYSLAIDLPNGRHIGECSVFGFDSFNDQAEIGIMIGEKDCWGLGYGKDALKTFLQHLFECSSIKKLILRTLDWNIRAQKCFEHCGFHPCGIDVHGEYRFILMEAKREFIIGSANKLK
jgi:RimJ/RimL family protein N-acetyltransferase